jgi:purine nucleoside phosphorylase
LESTGTFAGEENAGSVRTQGGLEGENVPRAEIGIICGSGLYQMEALTDVEELSLDTPFGKPSDVFFLGTLAGLPVAFLPRHGRGHKFLNRNSVPANICK